MSVEFDSLLENVGKAASLCFDLNGHGDLTNAEQNVFFQFAERITLQLTQLQSSEATLVLYFADHPDEIESLSSDWDSAVGSLEDLSSSPTSDKVDSASTPTEAAIDNTSSCINAHGS